MNSKGSNFVLSPFRNASVEVEPFDGPGRVEEVAEIVQGDVDEVSFDHSAFYTKVTIRRKNEHGFERSRIIRNLVTLPNMPPQPAYGIIDNRG